MTDDRQQGQHPSPIDETGALDDVGESRRDEVDDPILDDDVPASADRALDQP